MKYKVGDVVRLKSAEELINSGRWPKGCAKECGCKSYKIDDIGNCNYRSDGLTFDDDSIECLVSEAEMLKQEATYTFDELKKRVDALKDYTTKLSAELNVGLSIEIETEVENGCVGVNYRSVKGSSRINIMD